MNEIHRQIEIPPLSIDDLDAKKEVTGHDIWLIVNDKANIGQSIDAKVINSAIDRAVSSIAGNLHELSVLDLEDIHDTAAHGLANLARNISHLNPEEIIEAQLQYAQIIGHTAMRLENEFPDY